MFSNRLVSAVRKFSTTAVRGHGPHDYGGIPGNVSYLGLYFVKVILTRPIVGSVGQSVKTAI